MIPFNRPAQLGTEAAALAAVFEQGSFAGDGPFGRKCEARLDALLGQKTLLVTSATHALELAALLLNVGPGDEIIMPSFTFVSTANAFVLRGAVPVFCDVDLNGNLQVSEVEKLITPKTKAVAVVHYAGNSCDMDALAATCGKIPIVEDAAQAITGKFRGRALGTFGALGAFSFHETKNIGCGEGGALTIRDERFHDRAEYIREKGTNRRKFLEGHVDKYTWVDIGSSYVLSEFNSAYLLGQLEQLERIQARRKAIYAAYESALSAPIAKLGGHIIAPHPDNQPNQHLFGIVFKAPEQRSTFITQMKAKQISTPFHYVSLHAAPMGKQYAPRRPLPNTERLSSCLTRLPLYFNMTDAQVDEVIARSLEIFGGL